MCGHVARLEAEADRAGGFYTYCKLEAIPEPNNNENDDENEKTEEIYLEYLDNDDEIEKVEKDKEKVK